MDQYKKELLRYALEERSLSDSFFGDIAAAEREGIDTLEMIMRERDALSERMLASIDADRDEAKHRLQFIPYTAGARLVSMARKVDALDREHRGELLRRHKDNAMILEKLIERKKEYRALSSLFRSVAVTQKDTSSPVD